LIPIGPLKVGVQLPAGIHGHRLQLLVSKRPAKTRVKDGWTRFELPSILDHEVVVID